MSSILEQLEAKIFGELRPADQRYQEILKFGKMLDDAGIPHTLERLYDGWKIAFIGRNDVVVSDVIEHYGSYGNSEDKIEMMGLVEDGDVQGYMSAEEVFAIWSGYYQNVIKGQGENNEC